MDEIKASRKELKDTEILLSNLNERVKHLSILINSITGAILPAKK